MYAPWHHRTSAQRKVEGVTLPPNVVKGKGLKIPLTPTRGVVKEGVTYVP